MTMFCLHYNFFSLFVTATFSVLFGIVLKVALADIGTVALFVLWAMAFLCDLGSTLSVPNYKRYETNQLFHIFARYLSDKLSFLLIGVVSFLIQYVIFLLCNDLIITYIAIVACICTAISNTYYHKKDLLKCNSSIQQA